MTGNSLFTGDAPVASALRDCRSAFWSVAIFSAVVNILMLAGPLYMLQVYDRVLVSRSLPTLVALSIFLVGAYAFQAMLDVVRGRIVTRSAALLDKRLGSEVHDAVIRLSVRGGASGDAARPLRDLDQIRGFLTGNGPIAMVDLPWIPFFLLICWLLHPWLGFVATIGGLILLALTILTERASRGPIREAGRDGAVRAAMIEATRRNGETVVAMGMADALAGRWSAANDKYLGTGQRIADVLGSYGTLSRFIRLLLQSMLLGVGAWLVIRQELMPGAMIAAAIMMGRALAPLETAIANWRGFVAARDSIVRLQATLSAVARDDAQTSLPRPVGRLDVEHLTVVPPGAAKPVVADVTFSAEAGDAVGIIGPSGSGKTSLVRVLAGVWPSARGTVRLDGSTLDQWRPRDLGRHLGYLSQSIDLFDATVAENIARIEPEPDHAAVLAAGELAGADDFIRRLPMGYDTPVGEGGSLLSVGQRQRIGLARALYRKPFLLILDEPNAHLDSDGDIAFEKAVTAMKADGAVLIIVAHRPSALAACNKVLVLGNGVQQAFGPRDEVLRRVTGRPLQPAAGGASLRVVSDSSGGG
jgi:PrtD family type I secretion system ABC transporter